MVMKHDTSDNYRALAMTDSLKELKAGIHSVPGGAQ